MSNVSNTVLQLLKSARSNAQLHVQKCVNVVEPLSGVRLYKVLSILSLRVLVLHFKVCDLPIASDVETVTKYQVKFGFHPLECVHGVIHGWAVCFTDGEAGSLSLLTQYMYTIGSDPFSPEFSMRKLIDAL